MFEEIEAFLYSWVLGSTTWPKLLFSGHRPLLGMGWIRVGKVLTGVLRFGLDCGVQPKHENPNLFLLASLAEKVIRHF